MLLSTEINRTPTKVNRDEFVPHNGLEISGKGTDYSRVERTVSACICVHLIWI